MRCRRRQHRRQSALRRIEEQDKVAACPRNQTQESGYILGFFVIVFGTWV